MQVFSEDEARKVITHYSHLLVGQPIMQGKSNRITKLYMDNAGGQDLYQVIAFSDDDPTLELRKSIELVCESLQIIPPEYYLDSLR